MGKRNPDSQKPGADNRSVQSHSALLRGVQMGTTSERAHGIAPGWSVQGSEAAKEAPRYGNVISPSLEHDEGKGDDDLSSSPTPS